LFLITGVDGPRLCWVRILHFCINPNETTHLGLIRAQLKENDLNIEARLSIAGRTMYSLMNTGVHGTNGPNPLTSYKIYQCYVMPRLLYGLEMLPLNQKQLDDIDINACNEKINTLCSEIDRLNKLQVMAQRAVQDLKLSIKPSYANKASPSRTPEYLNNSSCLVCCSNSLNFVSLCADFLGYSSECLSN
jgi:hypothetical protein